MEQRRSDEGRESPVHVSVGLNSELEQLPELGCGIDTSFITGMAKSSDNLITLLDIDRLLGNTLAA